MVDAWEATTPEDFRFAPKVPQVISHERRLQDWAGELAMLLDVMRRLESRLGPLVLQIDAGVRVESLPVLAAFLVGSPKDIRYAVEIRRPGWLCDEFSQLLKKHKVVLVLADLNYMPKPDKVTTNFTSIRLLGKRGDIPDDFSRIRLDRERELKLWSERIRIYIQRRFEIFVFANNRFQGHGPATAWTFLTGLSGILPTS